jgi:hypothetical protein
MTLKRFDRRTLVLAGAGVAGAGAALYGGTISAGALKPCPPPGTWAAAETSLARIGQVFLREAATADERARLARLAESIAAGAEHAQEALLREATAALAAAPSEDFARGDVVSCAGWVLARGEAMACALVALTCRTDGVFA